MLKDNLPFLGVLDETISFNYLLYRESGSTGYRMRLESVRSLHQFPDNRDVWHDTSSCHANMEPVRPKPHIISSRVMKAPCFSHTLFIAWKHPGTGGTQPATDPLSISVTNAMTLEGPMR
ncbi:hypothetical protein BU25DRAFT_471706 [Macroventuria anomochaeta]|uniref:Uncharacterized protein n=1 Tax=Macroventuria anomochaeta TaxID=301207 RepID=A0ACB6RXG5_9PLEO|nr:uncharacterized protein BU25DRAFT_471706 [Macroventuria anomochaeta]KAF2626720.1 hypothetical protein BU25DRAFT_471706 [Macroventuria anomochaeta]